jgi:type I restriction enzyme, S subunit
MSVEGLTKPECFAVRRRDVSGKALGAPLYSPVLRLFLRRLAQHLVSPKPLREFAEINPPIDVTGLMDDSTVSFVPMDAVEDDATGIVHLLSRPLKELQKSYTPFADGDILWAKITPCMENGKSCIARGLQNGVGYGSTEFHVFRPRDKRVSAEFLWEFLNQETLRRVATYSFTGSAGHQRVPDSFLTELPFPTLDAMEQARLVEHMVAARAKRRSKLAEADSLLASPDAFLLKTLKLTSPPRDDRRVFAVRRSSVVGDGRCDAGFHHPRYAQILGAFNASPYKKRPLGDIAPNVVGGATPTKGDAELYATSGIKFLRILNVKANDFDLADLNYIREEVHEGELKRSQLELDDVLMTITGRVGNAAVVSAGLLPANINQHLVRLRITANDVRPEYLAAYLNSSVGLALSNRGVTGGTRIALDYGAIRALQIPVPPPKVQDAIVAEVRRCRQDARLLRDEAEVDWKNAKQWFETQLLESSN